MPACPWLGTEPGGEAGHDRCGPDFTAARTAHGAGSESRRELWSSISRVAASIPADGQSLIDTSPTATRWFLQARFRRQVAREGGVMTLPGVMARAHLLKRHEPRGCKVGS
jgi:hypothetical protein